MALVVMIGFAGFAIDLGRLQMARSELDHSTQAAAHAGAAQLEAGAAAVRAAAIEAAGDNQCDAQATTLATSDIEIGTWSCATGSFSPLAAGQTIDDADAVRVNVKPGHGRVPLPFASMFGVQSNALACSAVARQQRMPSDFGIIGVNSVSISSLGVLAKITGDVGSNGNVRIGMPTGLFVGVDGDARSCSGFTSKGSLSYITGSTARLTKSIRCPSITAPHGSDNAQIAAYLDGNHNFVGVGSVTIPSGIYVVHDLNLIAGVNVRLSGPVKFYVKGDLNIAAGVNLLGSTTFSPDNFRVRVCPGGRVFFLANLLTPVVMDLYAPDSDITIAVPVSQFTGRIVGKTVTIAVPAASRFTVSPPGVAEDVVTLVR